ncbi:MAG: endo alpha-1,4 polygalactosaminidase [Deltaproteobacteria bacterium]|nr:endo alpha-1,4 polygalactosaminidase [Deltaproteobacteria bacterium]
MAAGSIVVLALCGACGDDSNGGGTGGQGATTTQGGGGGTGGSGGSGTGGSSSGTGGSSSGTGGSTSGTGGGGQLWQPALGTTWQWQLSDLPVDTSVDVAVYDIDLFDSSPSLLAELQGDGRIVICYFSAGSWEDWRPDAGQFPQSAKGGSLDPPFQDELWLDIRDATVRQLMAARLDIAVTKGCDAVEPDNVDGYTNNNGFGLTGADQIDFNRFIATEAHTRGLSVGLKNDVDQVDDLVGDFDWALNEECFTYDECGAYATNFVAQNKAVFHAEYVGQNQLANVCAVTQPLQLSTILKHMDLDAFRLPCP